MKGLKFICVSLALTLTLSDARFLRNCPDCIFSPDHTYRQFAMNVLTSNGPADAACTRGEKVIHYGKDYGMPNDACCCLHSPKTAPIECGSDSPQCPPALLVGIDETATHYYKRMAKYLKDAPPSGCCPSGTYKWHFAKEFSGAEEDKCACLNTNKIADPIVNWRD